MDSWWDTDGIVFKECGMHFENHACSPVKFSADSS
ncbi:hypothetical protein AZE42_09424 [Rhizopogon vesiculosus]|uniref:Uncharacterized protein n=1 Tax=Rhizopogon vesiculosus TaxID=180088 RepID=A0A1J8PE47_9AGAM|nr:hypothetical protein AZE42_09424 [Rhizopogon vesiculosus]